MATETASTLESSREAVEPTGESAIQAPGAENADAAGDAAPALTGVAARLEAMLARGPNTRAFLVVLVLGALVFLPSLLSPLLLDDYLHGAMARGTFPAPRQPWDLYNFVTESDRDVLLARGVLPWWSHPKLFIRFLRPLPSLILFAEHRAFGGKALLFHLHSFAWWAFAVFAAKRLFSLVLPARRATLAMYIFALSAAHALPLSWVANREALLSLSFGTMGLAALVRVTERYHLRDIGAATLWFAAAALCGEYTLSLGGLALACALWRSRARAWVPALTFAGPAIAFLALRSKLGFGSAGSGFYADPLQQPGLFANYAPRRFFTLVCSAIFTVDQETLDSRVPVAALALLAIVAVGLLVGALRRVLRASAEDTRHLPWLLVGAAVSLAPMLAVVPSPRLLGIPMLGLAPAIASVLDEAWFGKGRQHGLGAKPSMRTGVLGLAATLFGFLHLVHGPATACLTGYKFGAGARRFQRAASDLRAELGGRELRVVRGSGGVFFAPFALGDGMPHRWRVLSHTGHVLLLRDDPHSFRLIAPVGETLCPTGYGNLFRSEDAPIRAGDSFVIAGMKAEVLDANRKGPRVVRFTFDDEVAGPDSLWITEARGGFPSAELPAPDFGAPFDP